MCAGAIKRAKIFQQSVPLPPSPPATFTSCSNLLVFFGAWRAANQTLLQTAATMTEEEVVVEGEEMIEAKKA